MRLDFFKTRRQKYEVFRAPEFKDEISLVSHSPYFIVQRPTHIIYDPFPEHKTIRGTSKSILRPCIDFGSILPKFPAYSSGKTPPEISLRKVVALCPNSSFPCRIAYANIYIYIYYTPNKLSGALMDHFLALSRLK